MKTKEIRYAYPSSSSAIACGFGTTGCFTVYVTGNNHKFHLVGGFATFEEAQVKLDSLDGEISKYSKNRAAGLPCNTP